MELCVWATLAKLCIGAVIENVCLCENTGKCCREEHYYDIIGMNNHISNQEKFQEQ